MKVILNILKWLVGAALSFFVVTFVIYFFNLDMRLVARVEPLLQKWYDRLPRKQSL